MDVSTAITQIKLMIQKQGIMLDSDTNTLTEVITIATGEYCRDKPLDTNVAITGNGTGVYNLPSTFTWGFSNILSVEYPIDQVPRSFIQDKYYDRYRPLDGASPQLILLANSPASDETFRVHHTYFSEDFANVPTEDIRAVLNLCASYACLFAATKMSQQANDNRSIDFADRGGLGDQLLRVADKFEKKYQDKIFGNPEGNYGPKSKVENLDTYWNRRHTRTPKNKEEDT